MELEATSSLDLKVTKEDLIDMLIEEQLSALEQELEVHRAEMLKHQEKLTSITNKKKAKLEKELMKYLPKGIVVDPKNPPTLSYHIGSPSTNLAFIFPGFTINMVERYPSVLKYTDAEVKERDAISKKVVEANHSFQEVNNKINILNGSNKRVKSRMLKNFLTKTEEGKAILKTMGIGNAKILQLDDKSHKKGL